MVDLENGEDRTKLDSKVDQSSFKAISGTAFIA